VAVFVTDNDGRYIVANDAAAQLTGYSTDEICRLSVWDVTPVADERDAEVLWDAFVRQHRQEGEYQLVTKDGRQIDVIYVAKTDVLPGLHLALITRNRDKQAS
jgi:PAS domain S-box-containing protein